MAELSHHHNGAHDADEPFRPSLRSFFNNFSTYDAPIHEKIRLALRNTFIKIRTHSDCCGHDGEPGC